MMFFSWILFVVMVSEVTNKVNRSLCEWIRLFLGRGGQDVSEWAGYAGGILIASQCSPQASCLRHSLKGRSLGRELPPSTGEPRSPSVGQQQSSCLLSGVLLHVLQKLSTWTQNQISALVPSLSSPSTVSRKIQRLARSLQLWSYRYLVAAAVTEKGQ